MGSGKSLITKYRPESFDDVIGQENAVNALVNCIGLENTRLFLFSGISGVGKTTLARITAKELGCVSIYEMDAATNNSVDGMREKVSQWSVPSLISPKASCVIIDECHALSKQAWQPLLKITEEPPKHLYIMLCTTDESKVIPTIATRATNFRLQPVAMLEIAKYLQKISKREKLDIDKSVIRLAAKKALGSVRQGLSNLSLVCGANKDEAAQLLKESAQDTEIIEICRAMARGRLDAEDFPFYMQSLSADMKANPEGVRLVMLSYFCKIVVSNKDDIQDETISALSVLRELVKDNWMGQEGLARMFLFFAELCLADDEEDDDEE